ncbi:MAG: sulfite exporter TauE/SafE family protein [Thermoflexales bacterium]|nr:sulfite exporter TauE/SafE family protein [Thermoflexales bacterium]MCS7324703.1 sulfite exporter TauE/SafE family protein [Thermoflexales bacterium]MCX7938363.1 sulfite exporter TauE/SafE family protein [Thermoflexales bacterium]MDW8054084.1 sulfite exporter TauE/SafE family protein [Anaerolineae bacterium]MDW8292581.1 sulfite exporter TauE/SafE family protein [Anaerolineae bacterium]
MQSAFSAFLFGWLIAVLGGLIGLGGAEFRLPVLVEVFKQRVLHAVMVNLIVSLVTVVFSLIFRAGLGGWSAILHHFGIVINLLAGSLAGAYLGAHVAMHVNERALTLAVASLLLLLSGVLFAHEWVLSLVHLRVAPVLQAAVGMSAGLGVGIVSSLLGVAGGELLIPAIVLIFGADIKLAGSLSLAVSAPTMLMGLVRYARRHGAAVATSSTRALVTRMSAGSVLGALTGSVLARFVSSELLYVVLGGVLLISALRLLRHAAARAA